jgi:membrane-associated progesterone receptor component
VRSALHKRSAAEDRKPLPRGEERDYTLAELASFDGADPERPLLIAVRGKVYDVTPGRAFYGPGGPYEMFAGKDCTRALAKMAFDPELFTGDESGLDDVELQQLDDWIESFQMKYRVLGDLVPEGADAPS